MKLVSLNVEGNRHIEAVIKFLIKEGPDVITLQEAPEYFQEKIASLGYHTSFHPRVMKNMDGEVFVDGQLTATKVPHTKTEFLYYDTGKEIVLEIIERKRETNKQGLLLVEFKFDGNNYLIGNTHFTWSPKAEEPNVHQEEDMETLLDYTSKLPPHVLVGDFNLPRDYSFLYKDLTQHYTDNIPQHYKSSLDKNIHQIGHLPEKAILFEGFMVDYIFTQTPYVAKNVRLEFGYSDHAAVVVELEVAP